MMVSLRLGRCKGVVAAPALCSPLLPHRPPQAKSLTPSSSSSHQARAFRGASPPACLVSSQAPQPPNPHRAPRFYVPEPLAPSSAGSLLRLPPSEAHHAARTLRLKEGDAVEACDGRGAVAAAEIAAVDRSGVCSIRLTAAPHVAAREHWEWTLAVACGSLKGGRADWLVEKASELGATALLPLLTTRSPTIAGSERDDEKPFPRKGKRKGVKSDGGDADDDGFGGAGGSGREGRWHRVAAAAMKQCLRPTMLRIEAPLTVVALCGRLRVNGEGGAGVAWVGTEGAPPVREEAAQALKLAENTAAEGQERHRQGVLIIGPEGDFTAEELNLLAAAGVKGVGLGALRLRTETAAVALLAYAKLAV